MITNSPQFVKQQYSNSSNLDIRIRFHEMYSTTDIDWHEWVFEQMDFGNVSDIIEFGCGSGDLWKKNGSKVSNDWSILLTDWSEGMLSKAQHNIGEHPNISYQVMDIQSVDCEDSSFDIAIANHMLYHVPNVNKALTELSRILKPGGTLYASTIGLNHMKEIYELAAEFDPALPFAKPMNSTHFGLENGEDKLRNFFSQVRLVRFESNLRVTNVQDLADYMFSIGAELKEALNQRGSYQSFIDFLESKKNTEGYVSVRKDSGMFICSNERKEGEGYGA